MQIQDYDNYFINSNGTVYNKHLKELKKEKIKGGYLRVTLYKDSKPKHLLVHRLVAQAFIPNPKNLPEINHIDNNPGNNRVENLAWCTAKENSRWSKSKPVIMYYPNRKYSKTFSCIRDAEKVTGINNSSISRCCKGKQAKAGGYKWEYVEMSETSWKDKKGYEL